MRKYWRFILGMFLWLPFGLAAEPFVFCPDGRFVSDPGNIQFGPCPFPCSDYRIAWPFGEEIFLIGPIFPGYAVNPVKKVEIEPNSCRRVSTLEEKNFSAAAVNSATEVNGGVLVEVKYDLRGRQTQEPVHYRILLPDTLFAGKEARCNRNRVLLPEKNTDKCLLDTGRRPYEYRFRTGPQQELGIKLISGVKSVRLEDCRAFTTPKPFFHLWADIDPDFRFLVCMLKPGEPFPGIVSAAGRPASAGAAGNLLGAGSGFEVGPQGMNPFCAYGWEDWTLPGTPPQFDSDVAHEGKYSLRLTAEDTRAKQGRDSFNLVRFFPVKLNPDTTYTLSAWMKSDVPGMKAHLETGEFLNNGIDKTFDITPEWKRYSLTFQPNDFKRLNYHLPLVRLDPGVTRGHLWIDAVQLEAGKTATSYRPEPLEFGAALDSPYKLFTPEQLSEAHCSLRFRNNTDQSHRFAIRWTVRDYWDRPVHAGETVAEVSAQGNRETDLPLPPLPCGYYRIAFDGDRPQLHDEVIFGVYLPVSPGKKLPADWPLGSHSCDGNPLVRDLGFGWSRSFFTFSFNRVCPEKGKFNFAETDAVVERCRKAGLNLMPILGPAFNDTADMYTRGIPDWAVERRPESKVSWSWTPRVLFPRIEDWKTYVRALVSRYKNDIKAWEILNEPNAWLTPEEYVPYMRATWEAAKEADPDCVIVAGCATSDMGGKPAPWTCRVLELDGAKHLDVLSIHMYSNTMPEASLHIGTDKVLAFLRKETARYGKPLPVWHTEKTYTTPVSGYTRKKFDLPGVYVRDQAFQVADFRAKAEYLLRETLIDAAVGYGPFFWFGNFPNANNISTRMDLYSFHDVEFDLSPCPELLAANGLARMLLGRHTPRVLFQLSRTRYCALFDGPEGALAALWDTSGTSTLQLPRLPKESGVFDFFGNPCPGVSGGRLSLGTAPVYLRVDGMNAADLGHLLRTAADPDFRYELSGGPELNGGRIEMAAYVTNNETSPLRTVLRVKEGPANWRFESDKKEIFCPGGTPCRTGFPVVTAAPSAESSVCTISGLGTRDREIRIPPFPSIPWLRNVLSGSNTAQAGFVPEGSIRIDGDPAEWSEDGVCGAATAGNVKVGRDLWRDPADLSAAVRFRWDKRSLYLLAVVYDDRVERRMCPILPSAKLWTIVNSRCDYLVIPCQYSSHLSR